MARREMLSDMLFRFARVALLGVCCLTLFRCTYNVATGRSEFIFISTSEEVAMGKSVHQQIMSQYKLVTDPVKVARIERIGQRIAQISDRQDYTYHFYLVDKKDELNAFTVPGGNVYVFSGLVDKLKSDDEIAAVLAHEIGHCAAKHTVKKFQAALGYQLVGSIVLSQVQGETAARIAGMSSDAVTQLVFSAYGRRDELQADQLGLKYLNLAGYDMNAMIGVFEVLKRESKGPEPPALLRTHPYLDDRIVAAKKEIERIRTEENN